MYLYGPYLTYLASPTLILPEATFPSSQPTKELHFLPLMPDDLFKKLPKFSITNFRTTMF